MSPRSPNSPKIVTPPQVSYPRLGTIAELDEELGRKGALSSLPFEASLEVSTPHRSADEMFPRSFTPMGTGSWHNQAIDLNDIELRWGMSSQEAAESLSGGSVTWL